MLVHYVYFSLIHATDEEFDQYQCPLFKGLTLTISGIQTAERKRMIETIQNEGLLYYETEV